MRNSGRQPWHGNFAHRIAGRSVPIRIALEQSNGSIYVFERTIARETSTTVTAVNLRFLEREVKFPLVGGGRFSGPTDAPELLVGMLRDYVHILAIPPTACSTWRRWGLSIYDQPFPDSEHAAAAHFQRHRM